MRNGLERRDPDGYRPCTGDEPVGNDAVERALAAEEAPGLEREGKRPSGPQGIRTDACQRPWGTKQIPSVDPKHSGRDTLGAGRAARGDDDNLMTCRAQVFCFRHHEVARRLALVQGIRGGDDGDPHPPEFARILSGSLD